MSSAPIITFAMQSLDPCVAVRNDSRVRAVSATLVVSCPQSYDFSEDRDLQRLSPQS